MSATTTSAPMMARSHARKWGLCSCASCRRQAGGARKRRAYKRGARQIEKRIWMAEAV